MSIPANKHELQAAISTHYQKLRAELISIPLKSSKQKELEGHAKNTLISVCDLVSYLIGWGELVLTWNKKRTKGEHINFPETGYKWNELGKLAQKFYADYKTEKYPELITKLDKTVAEIQELISGKTNDELYKVNWYDKWTLGRLIQFNTSSPYQNALKRLRRWKKQKNS